MRTFVERATGKVLGLQIERMTYGGYTFSLGDPDNDQLVGVICFYFRRDANELVVSKLGVFGHDNSATARNPHPGTGRLLMYLACKYAVGQGVESIRLLALKSAAPFYRQMGMHHALANIAVFESDRSANGRLQPGWLNEFDGHFSSTRNGGVLTGQTRTVLLYVEGKTLAQWQERAGFFACSIV